MKGVRLERMIMEIIELRGARRTRAPELTQGGKVLEASWEQQYKDDEIEGK